MTTPAHRIADGLAEKIDNAMGAYHRWAILVAATEPHTLSSLLAEQVLRAYEIDREELASITHPLSDPWIYEAELDELGRRYGVTR